MPGGGIIPGGGGRPPSCPNGGKIFILAIPGGGPWGGIIPCIGGGIPGCGGPCGGICPLNIGCCAPGIGGNIGGGAACRCWPLLFMLLLFSLLPPPPFLAAFNKSIGVSSFCSILADDGMSTSFDFNSKSSISPPISSIFFPFSSFSSSLPKNPANFGGFGMFAKNPIFSSNPFKSF